MTLPLVAYYTSRMGFHVRAGTDKADYQDFIDMMSKLDGAAGLVLCTEATKPSTNLFPGMYIKCTDSGLHYTYGGGSFSSGVYSGGTWTEDIYITVVSVASGNGNMIYGNSDSTGYSISCDNNTASNSTTIAGKASSPFSTVNNPQTVDFEVNIGASIAWGGGSANTSSAQGVIAKVYLTIDSSDVYIGSIRPSDLLCQQTAAGSIGGGHADLTYKLTKSVSVVGAHTCTFKIISQVFNSTGSASIFAVDYINVRVMASVS